MQNNRRTSSMAKYLKSNLISKPYLMDQCHESTQINSILFNSYRNSKAYGIRQSDLMAQSMLTLKLNYPVSLFTRRMLYCQTLHSELIYKNLFRIICLQPKKKKIEWRNYKEGIQNYVNAILINEFIILYFHIYQSDCC